MKPTALIQFTAKQLSGSLPEDTASLREACATLSACDLLTSYEGPDVAGSNGNVSERRTTGFIITATKLSSKQNLSAQDCVHIETCDGGESRFHGAKLPSSESLMHWHLYETFPAIQAIVHVHESNELLYSETGRARWAKLGIVETASDVGGGTTAVGEATAAAFSDESLYVILKNHRPDWDLGRTGSVVMGRTLEEAVDRALAVHEGLKNE
jgi:ribulose-5-phosphate 4-epimerase/fuculose-1-phosphate aldolase